MRRLLAGLGATALFLGACAATPPPGSDVPASSTAPAASAASGEAAVPGQPLAATDVLEAMRDSTRPGGVPEELQTDDIAAAVADLVWTFDGQPWDTIVAGGSCGGDDCMLELAGSQEGTAGEDVWVFEVQPQTGAVSVASADLHAVPADRIDALDRAARAVVGDDLPDELALTAVRWLPPPETGFVLAYRSGDEEGSCSVDVVLDASASRVEDLTANAC